ncbi:hypothetical protein LCGC14_2579330, partial [marine sediment metagenome]
MPVGDRDITLFAGGTDGYGDALNVGRDSYAWAIGFDFSARGRATLAIVPSSVTTSSGGILTEIGAAFEFRNTAGDPLILVANGLANTTRRVGLLENNTYTPDDDSESGVAYTGGVLYQHDDSNADTEVAYFCNGTGKTALRIRNRAGTFNTIGTATADQLAVIGSDLWRVIDAYKLEKLVLGTFPGTEANWSGVRTRVGTPSFPINKVLEFGGAPIVLTGSGVYRYNPAPRTARFENLTPFVAAHKDNGKGGFADGRGRIYYPTVNGNILVLSFGSQSQQGPLRFNWIDRNTPWGTIGEMTADAEHIYASLEPGSIRTQQLGLVMKSDDGGVFTTHTSAVTDQDYTTNADVSLLKFTALDFIYVGADEPFWGVWMDVLVATTGSATVWRAAYSDTPNSNSFTGITNSLVLDATGGGLRSGFIGFDAGTDIVADGSWTTTTVNSVSGKYGFRLQGSGTTTS